VEYSNTSKILKNIKTKKYFDNLIICQIIESQKFLGVKLNDSLKNLSIMDIGGYEFYVITLNNNSEILMEVLQNKQCVGLSF
jgi:hypothetical protein